MRYLHTMIRVSDVEASLQFWCDALGLEQVRRVDNEKGRFTLIFLAAPADRARSAAERAPEVELTWNWDPEDYSGGRNFGHLAYKVDDIYAACQRLMDADVVINRPPPVTAIWPSFAPRTGFRWSCFRKVPPCPPPSHGRRCRMSAPGKPGRTVIVDWRGGAYRRCWT